MTKDDGFLESVAIPLLVSNLQANSAAHGVAGQRVCKRVCKFVNVPGANLSQMNNWGAARALVQVLHNCSSEDLLPGVLEALFRLIEHGGPLQMPLQGAAGVCAGIVRRLDKQEASSIQRWGIRIINALCCLEPSMREELGERGGACRVVAKFLSTFARCPPEMSEGCSAVINLAAGCTMNAMLLSMRTADVPNLIATVLPLQSYRSAWRLGWKALRALVEGAPICFKGYGSRRDMHFVESTVRNEIEALASGSAEDGSESSVATVLVVVAALAEDCDANRWELRSIRTLAAAFVALREHISSPEVQEHGWRIVAALAVRVGAKPSDGESDARTAREAEAWKRAGVCQLAVISLDLSQNHTWGRVLAVALRAVANLASHSKALREGLRDAGVWRHIVSTLFKWKSRRATVMHACNALVNVVGGDAVVQEAAGVEGACVALILVLKLPANATTSNVQEWAWRATMELIKDCAANRKRFEYAGGCNRALAALKAHGSSRNVKMWALRVIASLSDGNAASRAAFGSQGACKEVVRALGDFKLATEVQAGLLAISSLIDGNEENRQRLLQMNACAIVSTALRGLESAAAATKPESETACADGGGETVAQLGAKVLAALGDSAQEGSDAPTAAAVGS